MITRVHESWLVPWERPLVAWCASRIPCAITPDILTVIGLVGGLVSGFAYWASSLSPAFLWLASAGLFVNWLGDSLDGTLARLRKIERPRYGFFVDNTTDVISDLAVYLGLGASPYMRFDTACLALMSYWIASLFTFIRAAATQIMQVSYHGVGPTEIRLGLVLYNFFIIAFGPISFSTGFGPVSPLDALVVVIFPVVVALYLVKSWFEGRQLAKEDGPRSPS